MKVTKWGEIEKMAAETTSEVGTGGMITKIKAAKIALTFNCSVIIAKSDIKYSLLDLLDGKQPCTIFYI
jgi:glutamate 5-kinase